MLVEQKKAGAFFTTNILEKNQSTLRDLLIIKSHTQLPWLQLRDTCCPGAILTSQCVRERETKCVHVAGYKHQSVPSCLDGTAKESLFQPRPDYTLFVFFVTQLDSGLINGLSTRE